MLAHAGVTGWLGTLPGWLALATLLGAAYVFRRGGGVTALDSLETANRVLEREVKELRVEVAKLTIDLAAANARTDVAVQVKPVVEWAALHEQRASERHAATLNVLELIAEHLGHEPNGHEAAAA